MQNKKTNKQKRKEKLIKWFKNANYIDLVNETIRDLKELKNITEKENLTHYVTVYKILIKQISKLKKYNSFNELKQKDLLLLWLTRAYIAQDLTINALLYSLIQKIFYNEKEN